MMNLKTFSGQGFAAGVMFAFTIMGMYQDWYGLEAYTAMIQKEWIDIHWSIWIAPLGLSLWFLRKLIDSEMKAKLMEKLTGKS